MELRTEAVDRVLEALSPALAAELERVVGETSQRLEAEFENRLQAAIRDAEESTRMAAEAERQSAVERAVEETREVVRNQVTNELQAEFNRRLEESTSRASDQEAAFQRAIGEWNSERDRLQQEIGQWHILADAHRQLADATSQPEIMFRWLNLSEPFANSLAVYTAKADGLARWKSRGDVEFPQVISQQTTDPESYFKPIVVRGKMVGAISAAQPYRADALDFLTTTLERAIELFGFRLHNK
jgi:hypothetical protein